MGWAQPAVPQHVYKMPAIELEGHVAGVGGKTREWGAWGRQMRGCCNDQAPGRVKDSCGCHGVFSDPRGKTHQRRKGGAVVFSQEQFCHFPPLLPPRHVAMSRDVFGCHNFGEGSNSTSIWYYAPTTKNYLVQNVSNAETEKTC